MKKVVEVIPPRELEPVAMADVNDSKYYGVEFETQRGCITKTKFGVYGEYDVRSNRDFTVANGWTIGDKKEVSLRGFIASLLLLELVKGVYEFDKLSELAAWLEEDLSPF